MLYGTVRIHIKVIINKQIQVVPVYDLELPDRFPYRDPELVKLIEAKLKELKLT